MRIGKKTSPEYLNLSLQEFFVEHAHQFKENPKYPFAFPNGDETRWCSVLEGGCQFSFDRDQNAPIRCIDCLSDDCRCGKGRYALQCFTKTRVYLLDIDQNSTRIRSYSGFCKYHTLTFDEERALRAMKERLMEIKSILFFYRTKCNGFRIGFDAEKELGSAEEYESCATAAEDRVRECTPDKKLRLESHDGGALFHTDRIQNENSISIRSHAYWSYPRVYHPIWLNPRRAIG
jgi:hypothetical protein